MQMMDINAGDRFDLLKLQSRFDEHQNMCVLFRSVFSNTDNIDDNVGENDDIIIVIFD